MAEVGRNAPCPCGSGRRYKECHGALAAAVARAGPEADSPPWLAQTMRDALHAQSNDMGEEAARLYRRVLEVDPENFDATHMLGLVEYERGYYDSAMALVRRAIELRPDFGLPRYNLRMLETMPRIETEICRDVLPRLVPRIDLAVDGACIASPATTHVIFGEAPGETEHAVVAQIVAVRKTGSTTLWDRADSPTGAGDGRTRSLTPTEHPRGGLLVMVGTARSAAAWLPDALAERALLIAWDPLESTCRHASLSIL